MRKLTSLQKRHPAGNSPLLMWVGSESNMALFLVNIQGMWDPCLLIFNHDEEEDASPYSLGWDDDDDFYGNDFDDEDDDEDDLFDDDDDLDDDFDDDFDDDEFAEDDDDDLDLTIDDEEEF